jgi:hypothetical protein
MKVFPLRHILFPREIFPSGRAKVVVEPIVLTFPRLAQSSLREFPPPEIFEILFVESLDERVRTSMQGDDDGLAFLSRPPQIA